MIFAGGAAAQMISYDVNGNGLIDVRTATQLDAIRYDQNGDGAVSSADDDAFAAAFPTPQANLGCAGGACIGYELLNDIDVSGNNWTPIPEWDTVFEGNGHVINGLTIRSSSPNIGFFSELGAGGNVRNVGLTNVDVRGGRRSGALVGRNFGRLAASYVINGHVESAQRRQVAFVGGLVGFNEFGGAVIACYADVSIRHTNDGGGVGGLAGRNLGAVVHASYFVGSVETSKTGVDVGALIGRNESFTDFVVRGTYFDSDRSGQDRCCSGSGGLPTTDNTPQTTIALIGPTTASGIYAGWDKLNVDGDGNNDDSPWHFGTSFQYPVLRGAGGIYPAGNTTGIAAQQELQPDVKAAFGGPATIAEGTTATYTVRLPGALPPGTTASWSWSVTGTEVSLDDFEGALNGGVVIPAATTSSSFSLMVRDDDDVELIESFEVRLSGLRLSGASPGLRLSTETLVARTAISASGLALVTVSARPSVVEEGEVATFTVALSGAVDEVPELTYTIRALSASLTAADLERITEADGAGSSTRGVFSLPATGTVTLDSSGVATIAVRVMSDDDVEGTERFRLELGCLGCGSLYSVVIGAEGAATVSIPGVPPPPPPANLATTSTVPQQVTVSWEQSTDASVGRVTGYESGFGLAGVSSASISYSVIAGSSSLTMSHVFTGLTVEVAYDFYIRAVNVGGRGMPAMASASAMAANYNADGDDLIDVATTVQLAAIRHDLSGIGNSSAAEWLAAFPGAPQGMDCATTCTGYELLNDIDLSSVAFWQPIGGGSQGGEYTGVFEGNGYVISNLKIVNTNLMLFNVGLFGILGSSGIIRNVGVRDVNVNLFEGSTFAGGLVGNNKGRIVASYVIGGRVRTDFTVGGLAASNEGTVVASYAGVTVHARGNGAFGGGLLAYVAPGGVVSASYSIGAVTGVSGSVLGGLIGRLDNGGRIISSYFDSERSGRTACCGTVTGVPSPDVSAKRSHELLVPTAAAGIYAGWNRLNVDGVDQGNDNDLNDDSPWDFGGVFDYPVLVFGGSTDTRSARRTSQQQAQPEARLTPTLSGSMTVSEGDTASYVVDLPTVLLAGVTASWSWTVGGTGIDDRDVDTTSGSVVIAAGASSASFSFRVLVDGEAELAEVMVVSMSNARLTGAQDGVSLGVPNAAAQTTIEVNELRQVTVSAQPTQVSEGGITAFTVALAGGVDRAVVVEYEITTASEGLTPDNLVSVTEMERGGTTSAQVNTLPLAGSVTLRMDGTAQVLVRVASDAVSDEERKRFRLHLTRCENCDTEYAAEIGSPSSATVVIRQGIMVDARVYLQGAYDRDGLNMLTRLADILPRRQPYWVAPWNYPATTTVMHVPDDMPGLSGVTSTIVDWVLVELRSGANAAVAAAARPTTNGRAAGLLLSDGRIVGINEAATTTAEALSLEGVRFEADLPQGDVYVLIHHRNHLSVMSAQPATNTSAGVCSTDPDYCVDFRDKQSYIGCGQVSLSDSDELYGMYAGDVGRTGLITRADLAFIGDNDSERPTYARMIEGNYLVDGDLDFSGLIARGDETEVGNNDSESSACSYRTVGN